MAILDSSNIVNNNVIQTNDLLQLYDALNYVGASTQYLVSLSGSLLGTASYATTASYALNGGGGGGGGVTQIIQGTGVPITSTGPSGTGDVTINSTAGGGGGAFPYTASTPAIISGSLIITGSDLGPDLIVTGSVFSTQGFTGSLSGITTTASYVLNAINAINTAETASYVTLAQTASYVTLSQTASYVTLAQTASYAAFSTAQNAISSETSSKVIVATDLSTNTYLPLIFASSNAAGTQQLNIDTDAGGPVYNPSLNSISASSFSGSLSGTASQASISSLTSLNTLTSSQIQTYFNINITPHYLTFVDANNGSATAEPLYTSANTSIIPFTGLLTTTTLSSTAITASSITSSFTGSLRGTSSFSTEAKQIQTVSTTTNASHYLTFVDANNATATAESLYTDGNISFNPSTNLLRIPGSITSSFTGSLLTQDGQTAHAVTTSFSATTDYLLSTTQWIVPDITYSFGLGLYQVPDGRDIGLIWGYTGSGVAQINLNTSSCQLGDKLRIITTFHTNGSPGYGLMKILASSSDCPGVQIIGAGVTPVNTKYKLIKQIGNASGNNAENSIWNFICVSASNGSVTTNAAWQLTEYTDNFFIGALGSPGAPYYWSQRLTSSLYGF